MLKIIAASMLFITVSALIGCALPEGYQRDAFNQNPPPYDLGGGRGSHGGN